MNDLRIIIEEENEFLRGGMPTSLFQWREVKQELADRYEEITKRVTRSVESGLQLDKNLIRALIGGTITLKDLTDENMRLLEGAMAASQKRIDAVLDSIRRDRSAKSNYSDSGQLRSSRFAVHASRIPT